MLKIGYFADGPWSHEAFKMLIVDKDISIQFVCVRYDTQDDTLKNYCREHGIPCLKHKNVNSDEFIQSIQEYGCDLLVSMSFNQIFRSNLMNIFPLKAINCHAGKLPFYRGRNILNWALINDEKEFGITVHFIDEGIDTGDIIAQETYCIDDNDSYSTLLEKAYTGCADILFGAVRLFVTNNVVRKPQSEIHPVGFYCTQRKVGDENIDWNQSSRDVFNFIRAICKPGPQARAFLGGREMKINRAEFIENAPDYKCIAGAIVCKEQDALLVKTGDSVVRILDYKYDGKIRTGDRFEV